MVVVGRIGIGNGGSHLSEIERDCFAREKREREIARGAAKTNF